MSGKTRNPERRCKICGGKCNKRMRYCPTCARERQMTQRTSASAYPLCKRGATEDEVFDKNNHTVVWCEVCVTRCPLAATDHLVVCDHFKEKNK